MAITASYVSSNQFTVTGNKTANLPSGLRLELNMVADGTEEVTVDSSSYSSGTGLTTCTIKESVITPNLATIKPAGSYASNVGLHPHIDDASGGEIPAAHLSEAEVESIHNTPIPETGDGKKFLRVADTPSEGYVLFDLIGAANQLVGANAAGDEIQFKTLTGATDEISVEDVAGTITVGLVQTYYNASEIDTALGTRDTAISAAQGDIDTHEAAAAPHSGHALSSHTHSASDVSSGTLDGDRLPAVSGTKRGGVPNTSGTPGSKVLYDDDTWKEPPGAQGGEANTTSNEGGGMGLALAKSGINLPFKTLWSTFFEEITSNVVGPKAALMQNIADVRLVRTDANTLTLTGVYQSSKLIYVAGDFIDLSTDLTLDTDSASEYLVTGTTTVAKGSALSTLTTGYNDYSIVYLYLCNTNACWNFSEYDRRSKLIVSLNAPTTGGYLAASGDGLNGRHVGWFTLNTSRQTDNVLQVASVFKPSPNNIELTCTDAGWTALGTGAVVIPGCSARIVSPAQWQYSMTGQGAVNNNNATLVAWDLRFNVDSVLKRIYWIADLSTSAGYYRETGLTGRFTENPSTTAVRLMEMKWQISTGGTPTHYGPYTKLQIERTPPN